MAAISFLGARKIIHEVASQRAVAFAEDGQFVSLDQAVGRTVREAVQSPIDTPPFDSAALDGYAVLSAQTTHATETSPIHLRVMGSMAAGSAPFEVDDQVRDGVVPCVEIMTGAPFPVARSTGRPFDACVPWEHTRIMQEGGGGKIVQIVKPPLTSWYKRITGSDFRQGDVILAKGQTIAPKHVMALASVGIKNISVLRPVRIGVISTGSELAWTVVEGQQSQPYKLPDANGPYLTAAFNEMGHDAVYLGALPDDVDVLSSYLRGKLFNDYFDLIVTTGDASNGGIDHVPQCVSQLNGSVYFHQVAMKPGYSVMFASIPNIASTPGGLQSQRSFYTSGNAQSEILSPPTSQNQYPTPQHAPSNIRQSEPALFGLPGNPIASAACMRFLITPYVRQLTGMAEEREIMAKVLITPETALYRRQSLSESVGSDLVVEGSLHLDIFRHAILRSYHDGVSVEVSKERSPSKTSPFVGSNCWVHVPRGHVGVGAGDIADIYPFCSPRS